jgi:choline kinase
MKAIILAAGLGIRLNGLIRYPKCLLELNGEILLERCLRILEGLGIREVVLVLGYECALIEERLSRFLDGRPAIRVKFLLNPDFQEGSILSLHRAIGELDGRVLLMDGDIYFEPALIERAVLSQKEDFFLIDQKARLDDEAVLVGFRNGAAVDLARGLKGDYEVLGEWAGCLNLSAKGAGKLAELLNEKVEAGERLLGYEFVIPGLFERLPIACEIVDGIRWADIDFREDIANACMLGIRRL